MLKKRCLLDCILAYINPTNNQERFLVLIHMILTTIKAALFKSHTLLLSCSADYFTFVDK